MSYILDGIWLFSKTPVELLELHNTYNQIFIIPFIKIAATSNIPYFF